MASKASVKRSAAVEELLDAIVKKKGFKQLAGYSIKCLQALLLPSRIGWEIQARCAFDLGGARAVLDVLVKYPTDAELLRFGLAACRSMVSVPGVSSGTVVDAETVALSISLLNTLVSDTALPETDRATLTAEALEYNLALARRSPSALPDAGLLAIIGTIADRLAIPPRPASVSSVGAALADGAARTLLGGTVFRLLLTLVQSREGLQTLAGDRALLVRLLAAGRSLYDVGISSPGSAGPAKSTLSTMGVAAAPPTTVVEGATLKGALDPMVRVLDRLSRVPEGDSALSAVHAGTVLMPLADWWVHSGEGGGEGGEAGRAGGLADKEAAATVMSSAAMLDLVNRLAGDGIQSLMAALALGSDTGPSSKQQAVRLLARLAELPDRTAALARDTSQARHVVDLLQSSVDTLQGLGLGAEDIDTASVDVDIAAGDMATVLALCQLTARVAERGGLQSILDAGGLRAALSALDVVSSSSCPIPALTVLHTALGASALRLLSFVLSDAPDSEVEYYGLECTPGAEHNRSAGEAILCHGTVEGDSSLGFVHVLTALLYAPVDALPDSSHFLAQCARMAYAGAVAREVASLALGSGGEAAVAAAETAGLVLTTAGDGSNLNAKSKAFVSSIGTALSNAARVAPITASNLSSSPVSGGIGTAGSAGGDRQQWAWLPKAAAAMATDAACTACASGAGAMALLESGSLAATVGLLMGKTPPGTSAGGMAGGAKKTLTRQASGLSISGKVSSYNWVRGMMREEPCHWVGSGGSGPRSEARAAAHGLFLAASLTTALAPHAAAASEGLDVASGATPLTPSALSAVRAVAAVSHSAQSSKGGVGDMGVPAACRAAVDALLEACLAAYAAHPADSEVYASFKSVVDTAGVSAAELVAAVDSLRAITTRLRTVLLDGALLKAAVRTSAISGASTSLSSAYSTMDDLTSSSPGMCTLESNAGAGANDKAAHARDVAAAREEVEEALPSGAGMAAQVGVLLSIARRRLLLLEAVSLSPTLSWRLVFLNGLAPLLSLLGGMAGIAGVIGDLDVGMAAKGEAGTGVTPTILSERLDDGLSHVCTVLGNLARVAYEVRSTGAYGVDIDGDGETDAEEQAGVPAGLDRRILPEQLFGPTLTGAVSACVNSVSAAGLKAPLFVAAAVPLTGWLASASNGHWAVAPPEGWQGKYLTSLLAADFVEAHVALLRLSLSLAQAGRQARQGGEKASLQAGVVTFNTVATVAGNLQHLAVHPAGSLAVAQRGASRQLLRALPSLLATVGAVPSGPAYKALMAMLSLLSVCVGAGDENASEDVGGSDPPSIPRLLYKQGLVDVMLEVAFSGVGLGGGGGTGGSHSEACTIALQIVSGVVGRKDVASAVATLAGVVGTACEGVNVYGLAAGAEADGWAGVGLAGKGAAAPSAKHAVLSLGLEESREGAPAGEGEEGKGSSPLLAAVQLVGLLVTTRAGRSRASGDSVSSALSSCASIVSSSLAYVTATGRVQESVLQAVAALTTSTDDKGPTPMPAPLALAAQTAVSPPGKSERDLLWTLPTACKVMRVCAAVLRDSGAEGAQGGGMGDPLGTLADRSAATAEALDAAVESLVSTIACTGGGGHGQAAVLQRLAATGAGANLLGTAAGRPKAGAGAGLGSLPTPSFLQLEALATLAPLSASPSCAARLYGALGGAGPAVVLGVMREREGGMEGGEGGRGRVGAGSTTSPSTPSLSPLEAIEQLCHVACIVDGVAQLGGTQAGQLAKGGATHAMLVSLGELLQAAVAASSPSSSSSLAPLSSSLPGLASSLSALSALAAFPAQCQDMLEEGLPSFLKSSTVLLPRDEGGAGAGGPDGASTPLMRALAGLLTRLAMTGRVFQGEGESEEGQHGQVMRDVACAVVAGVASSKAARESVGVVTATVQLIAAAGIASAAVSAGAAGRTVEALRADPCALRVVGAVKRAMTAGGAGPELLSLGRKVMALLQGGGARAAVAPTSASAEDGALSPSSPTPTSTPLPSSSPAAEADELAGLVDSVYSAVDDLALAYGAYTEAAGGESLPPYALLADIERRSEVVLEGVRNLALVGGPRYPLTVNDEGTASLSKAEAAAVADMREALQEEEPTKATEWAAFATVRHAVAGVSAWLSTVGTGTTADRFRPSKASVSLAYDILNACLPLVSRLASWAHASRAAALEAYYEDTSRDWEVPAEHDVPLVDAVASIGMALDAHLAPAEALLDGGRAVAASAAMHYHPNAYTIEPMCRAVRVIAASCGADSAKVLTKAGTVSTLLRLMGALRAVRGVAEGGQLSVRSAEGGMGAAGTALSGEAARQLASECEMAIASLSATVKAVIGRAGQDVSISSGKGVSDPRPVQDILPADAFAELLRASAALVTSLANDDDEEEESKKTAKEEKVPAGDAYMLQQARTLVTSMGGTEVAWQVLDSVAHSSLAAVTTGALDGSPGSEDPRAALKVFSSLLTALDEEAGVPPNARALRALYAAVATAMAVLVGEAYTGAVQASSAAALGHDAAAEEWMEVAGASKDDADMLVWAAPPDAPRLSEEVGEGGEGCVEDV